MSRKIANDAYRWHQLLWSTFDCQVRPFIFVPDGDLLCVRSTLRPNRLLDPIECENTWQEGQRINFRLRANVRSKKTVNGKKRDVTIHKEDEKLKWLYKRLSGCVPDGIKIKDSRPVKFSKRDNPITINITWFTGVLIIKDIVEFARIWLDGIGSSKAWGCGMLEAV